MHFTVHLPYGIKSNILHVLKRELLHLLAVDKKINPDKEHLAHTKTSALPPVK